MPGRSLTAHWLQRCGLRRSSHWDSPTLLDCVIDTPLDWVASLVFAFFCWARGHSFDRPRGSRPVKIVCVSDTHDLVPHDVPRGDLLIHAGDTTSVGSAASIQAQIDWLASLPHQHKLLVCGNHDSWFDPRARLPGDTGAVDLRDIKYLEFEPLTLDFENGRSLQVFGAPGVPHCGGPENAFQYERDESPWATKIPQDLDILITHTPPRFHLDLNLGCEGLLREVWAKKPRLHVFGHIHCGRGTQPVFWDRCQQAYEDFMTRRTRGLSGKSQEPGRDRRDVWKIWTLGWYDLWHRWTAGTSSAGDRTSLLVNAGVQDGNSRRLTSKPPITVWL